MSDRDCALTDAEAAPRAVLARAREIAAAGGRKHRLWDVIFDGVALLDGAPKSVRYGSRAEGVERLCDLLNGFKADP